MPGVRGRAAEQANSIADAAITAMGPLAARFRIIAEIARRCDLASMQRPSTASITARIARQRWLAEYEPGRGVRLVVDQVVMRGPGADGVDGLLLTLAILDPQRAIVGHSVERLSESGAGAAARLLVRMHQSRRAGNRVVVRMPAIRRGGWPRLREELAAIGTRVATPVKGSLRLGRGADLLAGGVVASVLAAFREPAGANGIVHPAALGQTIEAAVRVHNAVHGRDLPPFGLFAAGRDEAVDALMARWSRGDADGRTRSDAFGIEGVAPPAPRR